MCILHFAKVFISCVFVGFQLDFLQKFKITLLHLASWYPMITGFPAGAVPPKKGEIRSSCAKQFIKKYRRYHRSSSMVMINLSRETNQFKRMTTDGKNRPDESNGSTGGDFPPEYDNFITLL